jgi:methyltransferase (TIGR00027 family)
MPGLRQLVLRALQKKMPGAYGLVYARTRVFDRVIRDAVSAGADQLVIIGAGLDTRGIRLASDGLITYEVDQAPTPAMKRARLAAARFDTSLVRFVPYDFRSGQLVDALAAHGFDRRRRAVVIAEGLTFYLPPPAIYALLGFVTGECGPGSTLAFDYIDAGTADGTCKDPEALATRAAVIARGEPFRFGFHPGSVREHLEPMGFTVRHDFTAADLERDHGIPAERWPELHVGRFYGLCVATTAL